MSVTRKEFSDMAKESTPPSKKIRNFFRAWLVGGIICTIGQCFLELYKKIGVQEDDAKILVAVTMVLLSAILTSIGIYDKIAKFGGAGTLVPITGFANAVVSPALDNKPEGKILGTGVQMFTIAGPVIVYGVLAASIYGVIYYIVGVIA